MSLARELFRAFAVPHLWTAMVDDRVSIRYEMAGVVKYTKGIVRDVRVEFVPSEMGDLEKRTVGSLVLSRDECSGLKGIRDPQCKATFEICDTNGDATVWGVASSQGDAIVARSEAFVTITIVRFESGGRSSPNYYR